ncbi:MAG TPA: tetratricopeptide repeat protein [Roseiflexaceae bacterium]|nr:tetratricopeptide repeat protein [Roseiflexaceae bacterium]HMP41421.1 tetratricopeptide repeat protein [Roseiflexaceae bacterium]
MATIDDMLFQAEILLDRAELQAALSLFDSILAIDARNAAARYGRGRVFFHANQYDTAHAEFSETLNLAPGDPDVLWYLADTATHLNAHEDACAAYDLIVAQVPQEPLIYIRRGYSLYYQGEIERALEDFRHARQLAPQDVDAIFAVGIAEYELDHYDDVISTMDAVITLAPQFALAYAYRGIALHYQNDTNRALADCRRALTLENELSTGYFFRALILTDGEDHQAAIVDLNQTIRCGLRTPHVYQARGYNYAAIGDTQRALADLNMAIEIDPSFMHAYITRAEVYEHIGERALARADRKMIAKLEATQE